MPKFGLVPMHVALTSDLHFPAALTKRTILHTRCGYTQEYYDSLQARFENLDHKETRAVVICGDFHWDYLALMSFFRNESIDFYNSPLAMLQEVRIWLDARIPLVLVKGNHDYWFDGIVKLGSVENELVVDADAHEESLRIRYRASASMAKQARVSLEETLDGFSLGANMFLLKNKGILLDEKCYMYGFPYYNKRELPVPWSQFKQKLIHAFRQDVETNLGNGTRDIPVPALLCHHCQPPAKKFVQDFSHPAIDVIGFYWGHYHTVSDDYIHGYETHGPYQCVLPEKNQFNFLLQDIS
ncbi:hypothetical protein GF325_15250 [Candidatus Bathyarchaeota archaeon]|nr:hypothetical protein [Candidatus Bathyarchaeota archaeon]